MSSRLKLAGICFAAAFVLAACGGGGSPLDAVKAERDRLAEQLRQAEAARDQAVQARDTAQQQVMTLQGQLGTANDDLQDAQDRLQDALDQGITDTETISDLRQDVADAEMARDNIQTQLDNANTALMAANAINGLFSTAQSSRSDADAAVMAAETAVENAVKYAGMLDVASVKGNSAMAAANAQMVLDAQTAGNQAVMDAEAAQMTAESALTDAMALADSATKTGLVAALEAAVAHAKAQVTAAKAARDINPMTDDDPPVVTPAVDSLAEAVAAVTGGENADPQGTPKSIGEGVAMQIGMALLPQADLDETTPDGTATRVTHYATASDLTGATPPAVGDRTFHMNDSDGMTWEMIAGDAVMTKTISAGTNISVLTAVKAAPFSSMSVSFATDPTNVPAAGTNAALGLELDQGATYMGIPGFVFCGGADCSQNAGGDLTGSWYFRPTSTTAVYVMNDDGTAYMEDTTFSQWGHWLTVSGDDVTIHTYATTGANTASLNVGVATGCDPECSAMYSGSAAGMSVHKTFDGNAKQLTIDSGAFTAEVSLTARFGSAPMLKGRIWNFQGGAHTDSTWSVELKDTAIDTTSAAVTGGEAKGSGQAGDWAAQGYGPAPVDGTNQRPAGFIGSFNAHFTDGHAAGAFVTE